MEVKLYDLVSFDFTFILHPHICDAVFCFQILDTVLPIGQTVTERVKRNSLIVSVSTAGHRIVREFRHFFQCFVAVEGQRQFSGRGFLSEKKIRYCYAAEGSRIPGKKYRVNLFFFVCQIDRASGHQYYHRWLADFEHFL